MCGIAGQVSLNNLRIPGLGRGLDAMSRLLSHRGPDGKGQWQSESQGAGFVHRRLAVIDLSESAAQPMQSAAGSVITYNGEIYNYSEIRTLLRGNWNFQSQSDTECILAAYERYGQNCLEHLRGMFAFAIWDKKKETLFLNCYIIMISKA